MSEISERINGEVFYNLDPEVKSAITALIVERSVELQRIDIAKKVLMRGFSIEAVAEDTGLDIYTVKKLQAEMKK